MDLGLPLFIRLAHVFNILLISLMMRSGLEILSSFPKLYLNEHCHPASEWLRLSRKKTPRDGHDRRPLKPRCQTVGSVGRRPLSQPFSARSRPAIAWKSSAGEA